MLCFKFNNIKLGLIEHRSHNILSWAFKRHIFKYREKLVRNLCIKNDSKPVLLTEADLMQLVRKNMNKSEPMKPELSSPNDRNINIGIIIVSQGSYKIFSNASYTNISSSYINLEELFTGDHVFFEEEIDPKTNHKTYSILNKLTSFGSTRKVLTGILSIENGEHHFCPHNYSADKSYAFQLKSVELIDKYPEKELVFLGEYDCDQKRFVELMFLGFNDDIKVQMKALYSLSGLGMYIPDAHESTMKAVDAVELETELFKNRKRFDDCFTFTIDPFDAKDADDAVSYKALKNGGHEISVHIADVTYFLNDDPELFHRISYISNTCFLLTECLPMFPKNISLEKCSFVKGKHRLTLSLTFTLSPSYQISKIEINRGVINTSYFFSYGLAEKLINIKNLDEINLLNARETINAPLSEEIVNNLKKVYDITQHFNKQRMEKYGSLVFSTNQDNHHINHFIGKHTDFDEYKTPKSSNLIEELMLYANKYVAEQIVTKHKDTLLRVHGAGTYADESNRRLKIKNLLTKVEKYFCQEHKIVAYSFLIPTLLNRAQYKQSADDLHNLHFSLGFKNYTHFTSPIRRFSDIIVHYQLLNVIYGAEIPQKIQEIIPYASILCNFRGLCDSITESCQSSIFLHEYVVKSKITEFDAIHAGRLFYIIDLNTFVTVPSFWKMTENKYLFFKFRLKLIPFYKYGFKTVLPTIISINDCIISKTEKEEIIKEIIHINKDFSVKK